jgi:hypothetical protein
LDLLELSQVSNTGVSPKRRQVFVRELLTYLNLADKDFKAVNRRSILRSKDKEDLKVHLRIAAEIAEAGVMKKAMQNDWGPDIEDQMYKREAKSTLDLFIDSPIEALMATVRKSHPELVITVMDEQSSSANSARNNPTPIEEIRAPTTQSEELDEPPNKLHRLYSSREDEWDFTELAGDPWFHHGGGVDDGPIEDDE